MGSKVYALVKPELLVWARTSAHLEPSDAAKRMKVSETKLLMWEDGAERPTLPQLRKLARVYKRPLAVFYLPAPPNELGFDAMRDFRRLEWSATASFSHDLAIEIRQARERQAIAKELLPVLGEENARLPAIDATTDADEIGDTLRSGLGVTIEQQQGWANKYDALNAWISAVERLGVLVFQTSDVDLDEMRGFSMPDTIVPVIVLNAKDDPKPRSFTLVHELVHLLLNHPSLCDVVEGADRSKPQQDEEVFCNAVAAATLVPHDHFADQLRGLGYGEPDDDFVGSLASVYKVSCEVILRRLLTVGKISQASYEDRRRKHYERGIGGPRKPGFANYYRLVLRDNGPQFVGMVLTAYHQEALSSSEVFNCLGVKLNRLPRVENEWLRVRHGGP